MSGLRTACSLLPQQNTLSKWLRDNLDGQRHHLRQFDGLLKAIGRSVAKHKATKSLIHRPFQIFWTNPCEPQHSALLRFFLNPQPSDPADEHHDGTHLLRTLFEVLGLQLSVDERTTVECEVPTSSADGSGFIDVLICREAIDGRYAVVIENKINGAADTSKQIWKYVQYLRRDRKFTAEQIYVFYTPLRRVQQPSADSKGDTTQYTLKVISFEHEIIRWLTDRIQDGSLSDEMRDNLRHYRSLVSHLLQQEREHEMDDEILAQLRMTDPLPEWKAILALKEYVGRLETAYKLLLRERLIVSVQQRLLEKHQIVAALYGVFDDQSDEKIECIAAHASVVWLTIGIPVGETLVVALSAARDEIVFGYRRSGLCKDAAFDEFVRKNYEGIFGPDGEWYYRSFATITSLERCMDDVPRIAEQMAKAYERILPIWELYRNSTASVRLPRSQISHPLG